MSVRNPALYGEAFKSNLTDEQCAELMRIKQYTDYPIYANMIFNFPSDLVMESFETQKSIRSMIKERNIDYIPYIGELRPYQRVGMAFMNVSKCCMLGDGVGLGKTAEISGLINLMYQEKRLLKFVIAVETSAVGQTQIELIKFTGLNIVSLPSDTPKMKKAIENTNWADVDGIVIKHSSLKSNTLNTWFGQNIGSGGKSMLFNMFILDESSVIKGDTSQTHHYTDNICNMADYVYFMNATPFEKCLMDVYYQFDMMDKQLLPDKAFMNKNFCVYKRKPYWVSVRDDRGVPKPTQKYHFDMVGYKNESIFKDSLALRYIGRSKKQVGLDVPHVYKVYTVQPNPDQLAAIDKGYSYNEVLNCPSMVGYSKLEFTRKKCPKLDRLCELAEGELAGMKFMVYCWHVQAQYKIKEELEKLGLRCVVINGDDPKGANKDIEKLNRIQAFNRGEYDVIITNAQRSLNLYGADAMIMYSTTATVGRMEQIRGRIDRNVDQNSRLFIMLIYEGTGEFDLINEKARMRGKASRNLVLDTDTAIDFFIASIDNEE